MMKSSFTDGQVRLWKRKMSGKSDSFDRILLTNFDCYCEVWDSKNYTDDSRNNAMKNWNTKQDGPF